MSSNGQSSEKSPESYLCICGKGDGSGKYILCENDDCPVGWYHWECVKVTEEPVGTWLCLTCSPNAAFYAKQLAKRPTSSPLVPTPKKPITEVSKPVTPSSSKEKGPIAGSGPATAPVENKQNFTTRRNSTPKKGLAVKKPIPESPKPKWKGWQQMNSDEEEDFKKNVEAKWVEDSVSGKRRRSSKAVAEEILSRPRRLRTRSGPEPQDTKTTSSDSSSSSSADSKKSAYQNEENEVENGEEEYNHDEEAQEGDEDEEHNDDEAEDEDTVSEDSSDREMVSDVSEEHENWEYNMDVDDANEHADKDNLDELFEGSSDVNEDDSISPSQLPPATPMETEFDQKDSVEPSDSDHSNSSDNSSTSPQTTPRRVFYARKRGPRVTQSPDSTPRASPARSPAASIHSHISISSSTEHTSISDGDGMDIDNEDDEPEVQILEGKQAPVTVTPAVESDDIATRYQRQGNRWGEAPESAVRSTLPRLA